MIRKLSIKSLTIIFGLLLATTLVAVETATLSKEIVEARLQTLRADTGAVDKSMLGAYESVRSWLKQAVSHDQDTAGFIVALTSEPKREARILARIDAAEAESNQASAELQGLTPEEIEARLTSLRRELRDSANARDVLDRQLTARETNASLARKRQVEINLRRQELPDLPATVDPQALPSIVEANQWVVIGERAALEAEQRSLEAQLASQPARYRASRTKRAELTQQLVRISRLVRTLEQRLATGNASAAGLENININTNSPAYLIAKRLLATRLTLQEQRILLADQLKKILVHDDKLDRRLRKANDRYSTARRLVEFGSNSEVLGKVLLAHWHEIDSYLSADPTDEISNLIGDTVISRIGHEEDLALLASVKDFLVGKIEDANLDSESILVADRRVLVELALPIRAALTQLIAVESRYIEALNELDGRYRRLSNLINEYESFLSGFILWIPSHPSVLKIDLRGIPSQINALARSLLGVRINEFGPGTMIGFVAFGILLLARKRIRSALVLLGSKIIRPREDSIIYTIAALLLTLLLALPLPILVLTFGSLFAEAEGVAANSLSHTFYNVVLVISLLSLLSKLCSETGVGRVHFSWNEVNCRLAKNEADWIVRWWLPVVAFALFVLGMELDAVDAALGRVLMLLGLLLLGLRVYAGLTRDPDSPEHRPSGTFGNRVRWGMLILLSIFLFWASKGHVFTVNLMLYGIVASTWIGLALLLLRSLLMRWLQVAHRRLRLAKLIAVRGTDDGERSVEEEDQATLSELSTDTSELLDAGVVVLGIIALFYLWAPLLPVLDVLEQVTLWSTVSLSEGASVISPVTLQTIVVVLFVAVITFYAANRLPALVELVLRGRAIISAGARYTTSTLLNYLIISIGLITILSTLGVQWSQLQWLIAALGVGVGFGLQEIVANFISGLIILFERPIRVGDIVTVGENVGSVTRIRIRATTIKDWDGKELLVPNKEFVTGKLLNWTLSDPVTRITIDVGIAYGSDVEQALTILNEVAARQADVLDEPPPSIIFSGFGDDSLLLSMRCFIESLDILWPVKTELHKTIYARFLEAGIVIAFPQRDVHFDSEKPIRISIDSSAPENQ